MKSYDSTLEDGVGLLFSGAILPPGYPPQLRRKPSLGYGLEGIAPEPGLATSQVRVGFHGVSKFTRRPPINSGHDHSPFQNPAAAILLNKPLQRAGCSSRKRRTVRKAARRLFVSASPPSPGTSGASGDSGCIPHTPRSQMPHDQRSRCNYWV
jgi:hypothetical protein